MPNTSPFFKISVENPNSHMFNISLTVESSEQAESILSMPAWIPGSYMIRDFAKNIVEIAATDLAGNALVLNKLTKQKWLIKNSQQGYRVNYKVYAYDTSVRTAYLDQFRGFINGTSAFLSVDEFKNTPHQVAVEQPKHCPEWKLTTGLKRLSGDTFDFGTFEAPDYLTLIDHPFEMANFSHITFEVYDIPHHIVISGKHSADLARIANDLQRICQQHLDYFGTPYPIEQYIFMVNVVGDGFGGLEHLNSTALLCSRKTLPSSDMPDNISDDYAVFLSLCSHEYFHTWNVKRIKPAEFVDPDIEAETYSSQLWFYEGITSYIDDWSLNQCGITSAQQYLDTFAKTLTRLNDNYGRHIQTAAESSFDAWTKFYQQDENARNAIVSYYTKGAVIALCLDLYIRIETRDQFTLQNVMQAYWQDWANGNIGTSANSIVTVVQQVAKVDLSSQWEEWINGVSDLPVAELVEPFGVTLASEDASDKTPNLGINFKPTNTQLANVEINSVAMDAGLAANDEIIAVNELRVTSSQSFYRALKGHSSVKVHAFRRDELITVELNLDVPIKQKLTLKITNPDLAAKWLKNTVNDKK